MRTVTISDQLARRKSYIKQFVYSIKMALIRNMRYQFGKHGLGLALGEAHCLLRSEQFTVLFC